MLSEPARVKVHYSALNSVAALVTYIQHFEIELNNSLELQDAFVRKFDGLCIE